MTFSEFCLILYPFLKDRCKNKADLFDCVVLNSINQDSTTVIEKISQLSDRQKHYLCNGHSSFSHLAGMIYPVLDTSKFEKILRGLVSNGVLKEAIAAFGSYIGNLREDNFAEKIAGEYKKIVSDSSAIYRSAQLRGTAELRSELFAENGGVCPCCGRSMTLDTTKENAMIAVKIDAFDVDSNSSSQNIGLCKRCAHLYDTGELEKDLAEVKKFLEKAAAIRDVAGSIAIHEKLMNAIEELLRTKAPLTQLNMTSLKINQKIDQNETPLLYNKVQDNVNRYFPFLDEMFSQFDGDADHSYDFLSSSIKMASILAESNTKDKNVIFCELVKKVSSAGSCDQIVAEIIVSYFIQSCEVFREIPKQSK